MARIRSVKPELRTSEVVASWPREVRYAFVLLWGYLDDKGRGLDVPKTIAGDCFPHDDDVTPAKMDRWLTLMATKVFPDKDAPVCRYTVGGRRYLHTVNAHEHQRPNRPTPSRLPPCPIHEELTESGSEAGTESDSEPLTEAPLSDSLRARKEVVDGAGEVVDGAGEQGSGKARGVSRSRRTGAATGEPPPDSGPPGAAERIIADWIGGLTKPPQGRIVNSIGIIVQAALGEGQDPDDVAEGLRRWQAKGRLGPAALPSFIHEAANGPRSSPATGQTDRGGFVLSDRTVADLDRVRRMAELDAADQAAPRAITGGAA